jgi:hypothetical protein
MSQNWDVPPPAGTIAPSFWKTTIPNALASLRSMFSGTTTPSSTEAYMEWADTATGLRKQRNAGDSADDTIAPLNTDLGYQVMNVQLGALSASANVFIGAPKQKTWKIHRVRVISDTTSAASSGANNWSFQIRNKTTSVDLLATPVSTDVDGEITLDVAYDVDADQNQTIAIDDVLEFQITRNGVPTSLTRVTLQIEYTTSI